MTTRRFWAFVGRFSVIHVLLYTLIAAPFLMLQQALPSATQIALAAFTPYQPIALLATSGQIVRSAVLALVLYPFYTTISGEPPAYSTGKRLPGLWILFGALWGIGLLGSVEPMPGSIEGVIYTETPWLGHILVLAAGALEVLLFSRLFLGWEKQTNAGSGHGRQMKTTQHGAIDMPLGGYLLRFTLLHVITYGVFGVLFYTLQDYEEAFATQERFALYRSTDDPLVVAAIPIQILRGGLIALLLYPFYGVFM